MLLQLLCWLALLFKVTWVVILLLGLRSREGQAAGVGGPPRPLTSFSRVGSKKEREGGLAHGYVRRLQASLAGTHSGPGDQGLEQRLGAAILGLCREHPWVPLPYGWSEWEAGVPPAPTRPLGRLLLCI